MKKLIAIVLLACMLSAALFASESYIGASINSKFDFGFEEYENVKKDFSEGYLGFGVDMATYFGESANWGMSLNIDFNFPLYIASNGHAITNFITWEIYPALMFNFKYDFTDELSLESGVGVAMGFGMGNAEMFDGVDSYYDYELKYLRSVLDIIGNVGIIWRYSDAWALRGGVNISYTVLDSYTATGYRNGHETSDGAGMAPGSILCPDLAVEGYVGIAYLY